MAGCISCEYCEKNVDLIPHFCSVYQMEVNKYTNRCDMFIKRETRKQVISKQASELSKLRDRVAELEEENKMLKIRLSYYEG